MSYNPFTLEGKTILITGASSGIGRATAIECSKLGAKCVITGRNQERLQETFDQLEGKGHLQIIADLSTQEGIDLLVEQSPNIDGLVNNAGVGRNKPISFIKQEDLNYVFQTNAFAPILITRSFIKKKKINQGGSIVFTSSIAVWDTNFGNGIYGATKAALTTFARYCARELANKNIRVNSIHPGMTETNLIKNGSHSDEELTIDKERYPLKRYGQPEEIAWAIVYLLSDATKWITGSSLIIDGGFINLK